MSLDTDLQSRTKDVDRTNLAAESVDFNEIPLIDIGDLYSPDPQQRKAVAAKLGEACENVGFIYITGHTIPPGDLKAAFAQLEAFFNQPLEEKMRYDIHALERHRGYVPFGGLNADPHAKGADIQEGYEIGLEVPTSDEEYKRGNMMYGPNVWPQKPPQFGEVVYNYFDQVQALGRTLFRGFALALDLDETWFEDKIQKPMTQLRAIHYPPQSPKALNDDADIGIGAHTDYECFTILAVTSPGLQVQNKAGNWIQAPPIEGAFVINIGDIMERWTNGRFVSTVHRVINHTGAERYSLAFFFGANYHATISCLPTCQSDDNPPKYPDVTAGEWTTQNIKAAYTYTPKDSATDA